MSAGGTDSNTEMRIFTENNPEVMNALAKKLGLSDDLAFYDVYSLDDAGLLSLIPRPVLALLVILPLTESWAADREAEDAPLAEYAAKGPGEPVIWFKQTITHACGSIGLLHCAINGPASRHIIPGSTLDQLRHDAIPLAMQERAQMLHDSVSFEEAHRSVAEMGDSATLSVEEGHHLGQHFVAFVKGDDGHLWELEGSRKGPLDRGVLAEDQDALSPEALDKGLRRLINLEQAAGGKDLRFSAIALARRSS